MIRDILNSIHDLQDRIKTGNFVCDHGRALSEFYYMTSGDIQIVSPKRFKFRSRYYYIGKVLEPADQARATIRNLVKTHRLYLGVHHIRHAPELWNITLPFKLSRPNPANEPKSCSNPRS